MSCPKCGKPLKIITNNGITVEICDCGYHYNRNTGEVKNMKAQAGACIVRCPKCQARSRVCTTPEHPEIKVGDIAVCEFCKAEFPIPARPDPDIYMSVTCPHCEGKSRVPANKGKLKVTCGHCGEKYLYDSGTWPGTPVKQQAQQPKPQPRPQTPPPQRPQTPPPQRPQTPPPPQPEPQSQPRPQEPPCRTITIERATHAYKEWDLHGLENAFRDKWIVRIVLDDVEQGHLKADEVMTLDVDSGEHTLRYNLLAPKYWIPPGRENYLVSYFRDSLRIGPENDEFRDGLTLFVLKMFRGRGIKDRILDPNNHGNKVRLDINSEGIRLSWTLEHTKGLKQWLTGEGEEKISYSQMGLTPLAEEMRPAGYWEFLQMWVEKAIVQDKEADMTMEGGGFTFRRTHDLY